MRPVVALGASVTCAVLAIALVGLDLAFNVDYRLETRTKDGTWRTWTTSDQQTNYGRFPSMAGCAGRDLRLVVHNGDLWAKDIQVSLDYYGFDGTSAQPVMGTWHLARGETRDVNITIPASAFHSDGTAGKPVGAQVNVNVIVGTNGYLSTCVQQEAPA